MMTLINTYFAPEIRLALIEQGTVNLGAYKLNLTQDGGRVIQITQGDVQPLSQGKNGTNCLMHKYLR
jgi:hypothetical protein